MSAFEELAKAQRELEAKIREQGSAALKDYFNELFAELPDLQMIAWDQWIPSFNDGDPCEFTISEIGFVVNGVKNRYASGNEDPEDYIGYGIDDNPFFVTISHFYDNIEYVKSQPAVVGENNLFVENFLHDGRPHHRWYKNVHPYFERLNNVVRDLHSNEQILQYAFDSHASVKVTRDEIVSEYYECGY